MINDIDPIIDKIIYASINKLKSIEIKEYISTPVMKELRKRGYNVSEKSCIYIISW